MPLLRRKWHRLQGNGTQTITSPIEVFRKAGEMGFMGMYTPESAGGFGMSRLDAGANF